MRRLILLTIFAGLLIAGFVFAESQKPPPPLSKGQPRELQSQPSDNSDVNSAKKITNTLPALVVDKSDSTPENSSPNTRGKENTYFNVPRNDDPMIRYTFWLMIFTGVLAISTIGLWIVTFFAGKDTKKAANAAQKSADVAEKTVETMAETAQRQLRAYVFLKHDKPLTYNAKGCLTSGIIIKNFGQTPAYNLMSSLHIGLYPFPLTMKLEQPSFLPTASKAPLAPTEYFPQFISLPDKLNQTEIDSIQKGESAIFILLEVLYSDIFRNDHRI